MIIFFVHPNSFLSISSSPTIEGRGGLTSYIRSPIWEMSGKNHLLGQAEREESRDFEGWRFFTFLLDQKRERNSRAMP